MGETLMNRTRQPWLHQLAIAADGNATVVSSPGGDITPGTVEGLYVDDARVLSSLVVTVGDEPVTAVDHSARGAGAEFFGAARGLGDPGADATVEVRRTRRLDGPTMTEEVTVTSRASAPVQAVVRVELAADGLPIVFAKYGVTVGEPAQPEPVGQEVRFRTAGHQTAVGFDPAPDSLELGADTAAATRRFEVGPGETATWRLEVSAGRTSPSLFDADAGSAAVTWDRVRVEADDPRLGPLVAQSVEDLHHLVLRDPEAPKDVFVAAGSPWYLTLFGRDSIWAARMMLPFGTELAAGTLRALARRQGIVEAPELAEQPGKILHEVRRAAYASPDGTLTLPPLYYGTVDATALWVCLLVDAWRWGLPEAEVRALLPNLHAALGWITGPGQPDDDGLLKYLDTTGAGLANQGWKDSPDSMRLRDGRVAEGPIALVEAQAYAVEALLGAAHLLDRLGEDGADRARGEGEALRDRLNQRFWVGQGAQRYLAMALDGQGRPVDGLGSNMAHVLGTGSLSPADAAAVAATLTGEELLDPYGVRTLGSSNGGFNPIGYHTGSIWTHDTAIAALGLAQEGHVDAAARVVRALVDSGAVFDGRWPELYSGLPVTGKPAPYPASCRPQAWAAASAGAVLTVALGLQADLPARTLTVRPARSMPFGELTVEGIRLGAATLTIRANRAGGVDVEGVPADVRIVRSA
jgi:glycogen debranching enzyme